MKAVYWERFADGDGERHFKPEPPTERAKVMATQTPRRTRSSVRSFEWGLLSVFFLAVMSSGLATVSAIRTEKALHNLITENLEQARAIYELEIALLEESEFTFVYFLGGGTLWQDELAQGARCFETQMNSAKQRRWEPDQQRMLAPIAEAYAEFRQERDRLITRVGQAGTPGARQAVLEEVRGRWRQVFYLCELLAQANDQDITAAVNAQLQSNQRLWACLGVSLFLTGGLALALSYLLMRDLFRPLRLMADEAHRHARPSQVTCGDEIQAVGKYLESLKADVRVAQSHLARSRNHLLDAEKLASVGKLAASVAHEIRSPLTSLRLRLFSMQNALRESGRFEHDLQVMSEEIGRLDGIVRSFLEFSRPPELRLQRCNLSLLIDKTLELLRYKFDTGNILVERAEPPNLPPVVADSQQVRQVLLNLLNNATEALPRGGTIAVSVALEPDREGRLRTVFRVRDNGPGIPEAIRDRIFAPFCTTKDNGAGLGLWIAHQIMAEHRGGLELEESTPRGSVFSAWFPLDQNTPHEQRISG